MPSEANINMSRRKRMHTHIEWGLFHNMLDRMHAVARTQCYKRIRQNDHAHTRSANSK